MSFIEALSWIEFRNKRGTLHLGRRIDRAVARVAVWIANRYRDTEKHPEPLTVWDFMPFEDEPPITMEQAMREWE